VHAPQVWATYGDLGANSTVAIIDTGIDYTHADFGGPGTTAAYQTALATDTVTPTYPDPSKILGGFDFAGDAYDGADPAHSTPAPDPNPLDCDSHGTHVAGIIAGYGENPDGSKFTGNYATLPTSPSAYQALFRIGPGMAPEAQLYAYKVFGCQGSTNLIGAAIDRAEDPNQDNNMSDHVDVINMSLGSDFDSPQDGDSVLSNAASQLGISVVVAAGNGGDLYDVAGAPGNAQRVIGVAASVDAYSQIDTLHATVNSVTKTYGAQRSVAYDWANKADLSGNVVKLTDANNLNGCDPISQNLTGEIVFLEWTDNDATRRCGSAARSQNAKNAGAIGAILGEDEETFAAGIAGSADIPVVQVVKSAADEIRTALNASQTVAVTGTSAGDFSQLITANDDKVASFSSRGIREAGDLKPDVSGVGASVFSAGMGTGNQGISDSGTSMATPMVAGLAALIRSQNSSWNPEEVKADIMNTADDLFTGDSHTGTKYAPNRVGAGLIDAKAALDNPVLAYVTDDPGAVSASFGPLGVTAPHRAYKDDQARQQERNAGDVRRVLRRTDDDSGRRLLGLAGAGDGRREHVDDGDPHPDDRQPGAAHQDDRRDGGPHASRLPARVRRRRERPRALHPARHEPADATGPGVLGAAPGLDHDPAVVAHHAERQYRDGVAAADRPRRRPGQRRDVDRVDRVRVRAPGSQRCPAELRRSGDQRLHPRQRRTSGRPEVRRHHVQRA